MSDDTINSNQLKVNKRKKCVLGTPVSEILDSNFTIPSCLDCAINVLFKFYIPQEEYIDSNRDQIPSVKNQKTTSDKTISLQNDRLYQILLPTNEILLSSFGPFTWYKPMYGYQVDGVKALISKGNLLLADDMGLGKTIQTLVALRILFFRRIIENALIIVPASLTAQWRKEIHTWVPELRVSTVLGNSKEREWLWRAPAHIYLISYDAFRSDFDGNNRVYVREQTWNVVVLDEAHKIKNRETSVGNKCKALYRQRSWALTGTPLENCEDDLASVTEFITSLEVGERFQRYYPGTKLRERHREVQLRRKKKDVLLQLPPITNEVILLNMTGAQRTNYDIAEKEGVVQLKENGPIVRVENILALIMKLKQICNFDPISGKSAKMNDMADRLMTLVEEGHRAIIFSQYTDIKFGVRAIAEKLIKFNPLIYTGALSQIQREEVINKFKNDHNHKVLVLSLRAGGQGLNLQTASYVFHFDRWWNPAVENQANGRVHRIGQNNPVHVYRYIIDDTIEQRIDEILKAKQMLFNEIVDDVSIDIRTKLSSEEIFGLFGLKEIKGIVSK